MTAADERKTLDEHVHDALLGSARRILAGVPDTEDGRALRATLAEQMETITSRLTIEFQADTHRGRPDPRSLRAVVRLLALDGSGAAIVCAPLVRDLVDGEGQPVDARQTYRDLRDQAAPIADEDLRAWLDGQDG